jgi:hypothetical protein
MKAVVVRHVKMNMDVESFSFESVKEAELFVVDAKKNFGWGVVYVDRATLQAHKGEIAQAIELKRENIVTEMNRIFKGSRNMYFSQWDGMVKRFGLDTTLAHFEAQLKPFVR